MKGYTDTLAYITTPSNRDKLCSQSSWTHVGLQMMTRKWRTGEHDPNRGLRLKNMVFSDFGEYIAHEALFIYNPLDMTYFFFHLDVLCR